jgi:protein O-GlcNAc transferase
MSDPSVPQLLAFAFQCRQGGRAGDAESACRQILAVEPDHLEANYLLGALAFEARHFDDAGRWLRRVLELQPNVYEALGMLAVIAQHHYRFAESLVLLDRALALGPNDPRLHYNKGVALVELNRFAEAVACFQRTVQLQPDWLEACHNLGNALAKAHRVAEAIDVFRQVLRRQPHAVITMSYLAVLLQKLARNDEAVALFRQAVALKPEDPVVHGNLVYGLHFMPRASVGDIRAELALWNQRHAQPLARFIQPHANDRDPERRLRIGFVSPNFYDHVVARNVLPIFKHRDREAWGVFCYSNHHFADEVTAQFRGLADHWRDVHALPPVPLAERIREDRVDILVDLALHMDHNSLLSFACKPAPVQVTFAGYPGSTGLSTMDYRLSDPYLDPPAHDVFYCEKTVRLPSTFWCFDAMGETLAPNPLPAAGGGVFTFGCLNTFGKTNEPTYDLWSRVMARVPNSRLLLMCPEGAHRQGVRDFFAARHVAPRRIQFVTFRPRRQYLELYHQIDLCLDTLPYNGHSTSLDALWMGVPVLTLVGQTVVGRAGLSQLMNLGLAELITHTPEAFVKTAAALAGDLPRLGNLRATLRGRMEASPLMDASSFTRAIESSFRQMWRAWCGSSV